MGIEELEAYLKAEVFKAQFFTSTTTEVVAISISGNLLL